MGTFLKWFDNGFLFLLTKREYICRVSGVLADLPCNQGKGLSPARFVQDVGAVGSHMG